LIQPEDAEATVADGAILMHGFAKSRRQNIGPDEAMEFKEAAKHLLALTERQPQELLRNGDLVEVKRT
jgi:hypothetical protein